jgi:hypothetical protein
MTMEKYGVESVQEGQKRALELAKIQLAELNGAYQKTASEASEAARLEAQIAELEAAIGQ